MRTLYKKNEQTFAIVWIVIYCALLSFANPLNDKIGIAYSASAVFCILQSIILFTFIRKNNLLKNMDFASLLYLPVIFFTMCR